MREMKDSGIDYIGQIPLNWKECRLKFLCLITTGNEDTQNSDPDGEFPFYVRSPIIEKSKKYTFDGEGILVAGDGAGAGRIFHHAYGKYAVHQRVYRLYNFGFNSNFICYYLSNLFPFEMDKGSAQSTVPSMRLPMLSNFTLFLPELTTASKIADFLDQKCSEIDALTADIQTQIETLEEYKKSVITEAVTKGLDPNVEMKDSGVEWIGKIPSSWKNKTLRHLLIDRVGGAWGNEPANENEGTVCLRIADFDFDKGLFKECALDELTYRTYTRKQIKKLALREGDILIEKSGGGEKTPVGRAVYYDGSYGAVLYANFMERLRFKSDEINSKFVEYWLRTWYFCRCSPFYINQTIGIQNIDLTLMLAKEQIFFPLLQDQYKIVDFLDQKCSEIDQTISEKQQQLETLAEYKKSLIYEYVTGKKEVA